MKAYNTPKDELHIESDTGETLVSITPEKTTIANLEGGGGGKYEIELSYDGTQKVLGEFETSDEADAFITDFFNKYDLISANITDFPLVGTVPMILRSNGVYGYYAISPFITGLVVGFITLSYIVGGIGYEVIASFSSFDVAINGQQ